MISSYAPTSDALETDHSDFEDSLTLAISRRKHGDNLVMCADANASLGRCDPKHTDDHVYFALG